MHRINSAHAVRDLRSLAGEGREQERPQDFGYGVNAPLPPEVKKKFENLSTKWCILKYI